MYRLIYFFYCKNIVMLTDVLKDSLYAWFWLHLTWHTIWTIVFNKYGKRLIDLSPAIRFASYVHLKLIFMA